MKKDFQNYFQLNSLNESDVTILTISFKTENDMATWNSEVDNEREILMKRVTFIYLIKIFNFHFKYYLF